MSSLLTKGYAGSKRGAGLKQRSITAMRLSEGCRASCTKSSGEPKSSFQTHARSTHEATAVLHHTSYSITELDSLKLHTNFIRAQAERLTSMINELVGKIEAGEITMEDFSLK